MNQKTLEAIKRHGESLLMAFPNAIEKDPVTLCKKLRRIENSLTKPLTDYCNGDFDAGENGEKLDAVCDKAKLRVASLLMITGVEFDALIINRDPRGHALKLDDNWTREYNDKARKIPKCCACGCDTLACEGIGAHSGKEQNKNALAIAEWRKVGVIYTDMGGYGILAPDLNQ